MGHVNRVVDGHPPGGRDGLSGGLLAVSRHLLSTTADFNWLTKQHETGRKSGFDRTKLKTIRHCFVSTECLLSDK